MQNQSDSFSVTRSTPMLRGDPTPTGPANPYSSSTSTGAGAAPALETVPIYRLFDITSIGIAAFFGSPIAGTALMAINYRRLARHKEAVIAFLVGLLGTAAVIAAASLYNLPSYLGSALPVILFVVTYQVAKPLQGPIIERHLAQGGKLSSRWAAFGLSILVCAALAAVVFGGVFAYVLGVQAHSTVKIGKDNVTISGTATKQDALSLGDRLKQVGFFRDEGISVLLSKGAGPVVLSFVVQQGTWDSPDSVFTFEEIGREAAPAVGGLPIKVRLVDRAENVKKKMTVGSVRVGTKDDLFYFGAATQADAKALGQSLKSAGFFLDRGVSVFLAKNDDGTTITFIVGPNIAADPAYIAQFETLLRNAASSVGGLPIRLRLANPQLQTEKVETVN